MHLLTSLIIVAGFVLAICLCLVKVAWDLSQVSVHESPAIPDTPGKPASAEGPSAMATEPHASRPAELNETHHVRLAIRAVSDHMERRFAEFAGVPSQNPLSRQQWEDLWETEL
jgi:hypothetical protein